MLIPSQYHTIIYLKINLGFYLKTVLATTKKLSVLITGMLSKWITLAKKVN